MLRHRRKTISIIIVQRAATAGIFITNDTSNYKPGCGLPLSVLAKIKPVYKDLYSDELLSKYLHGKTQNSNECLNGMIWQRGPKTCFIGFAQLELVVYDAVSHFNMGAKAALDTYEVLDIEPGLYTLSGCMNKNSTRISCGL